MKPIVQVELLIESHGVDYTNCPGCDICEEIESKRKLIDRNPAEKYKHILDKGHDMKKSDIKFLLDNEVDRSDIRKALKMGNRDFQTMMVSYGFSKRMGDGEMEKDSVVGLVEEYKAIQAEYPNEKLPVIAKKMGVKYQTLYYNVNKWRKQGLLDTSSIPVPKETYESVVQQVGEAIKGDPDLIKKLQGRITELEQQAQSYPALMERASKLEIENMKLEDNLKKESYSAYYYKKDLDKAAEKIGELKGTVEDLMADVAEWREQAHSYARENDLMNGTNRNLREIAEQLRRERNASVELLKVTL